MGCVLPLSCYSPITSTHDSALSLTLPTFFSLSLPPSLSHLSLLHLSFTTSSLPLALSPSFPLDQLSDGVIQGYHDTYRPRMVEMEAFNMVGPNWDTIALLPRGSIITLNEWLTQDFYGYRSIDSLCPALSVLERFTFTQLPQ